VLNEKKTVAGQTPAVADNAALHEDYLNLKAYIESGQTRRQKPRAPGLMGQPRADRPVSRTEVTMNQANEKKRIDGKTPSAAQSEALYKEFLDLQGDIETLRLWRQEQRAQGVVTLKSELGMADQFDLLYSRLFILGQQIVALPHQSALTLRSKASVILEFAEEQSSDFVHQAALDLARSIVTYIADTTPDEIRFEVLR
jgi:hypothetical protein